MEKYITTKERERKDLLRRFRWRFPKDDINKFKKNEINLSINSKYSSDGNVVGTPSSNNSTIDLIIKKSFETDSYLNQFVSNSECDYESDEMSFSSDDDFGSSNKENINDIFFDDINTDVIDNKKAIIDDSRPFSPMMVIELSKFLSQIDVEKFIQPMPPLTKSKLIMPLSSLNSVNEL